MDEEKLIFLLSQPRAGSTLTQMILGAHSSVYTRSEPWIMLPLCYMLKEKGTVAEYDHKASIVAVNDFISEMSSGRKSFNEHLKTFCLSLYGEHLAQSERKFFLDKTPRYYLIVNELKEIFPQAKYIVLIRHPLDVLNSMLDTWVHDNFEFFKRLQHDLFDAIDILVETIEKNNNDFLEVRYEELLADPGKTVNRVCNYLGIEYEEEMLQYNRNAKKMLYGDPRNVYQFDHVMTDNRGKWMQKLANPTYWNFFSEYLDFIGKRRMETLGYSYAECREMLLETKPEVKSDRSLFEYVDYDFS